MGRHFKNMGRTLQGKPAETDAKENGKIARVFKGAFKVEGALISSINRNAEWALNTLARLEQTTERRPSVLEAMREQVAKTEPAKKRAANSNAPIPRMGRLLPGFFPPSASSCLLLSRLP